MRNRKFYELLYGSRDDEKEFHEMRAILIPLMLVLIFAAIILYTSAQNIAEMNREKELQILNSCESVTGEISESEKESVSVKDDESKDSKVIIIL